MRWCAESTVTPPLPDQTRVLYVSPLKALSNDIRVNLLAPLEGIGRELAAHGHGAARHSALPSAPAIPTQAERNAMRRRARRISWYRRRNRCT